MSIDGGKETEGWSLMRRDRGEDYRQKIEERQRVETE